MSEINIEAVRKNMEALQAVHAPSTTTGMVLRNALSALNQLAKENERLTAENIMLAAGACINPNGNGLLGDDHGNFYCGVERERVALDKQVTDLMARLNEATAKHAAMQEAVVEALHRAEIGAPAKLPGLMTVSEWATEPLRPFLPTPEPEPVDPLVEAGQFLLDRLVDHEVRIISDDDAREWMGHVTPAMARLRAALSARGIELRKIGEGE